MTGRDTSASETRAIAGDEFLALEIEDDVLILTRSEQSFPSLDALAQSVTGLSIALGRYDPQRHALIVDLRRAKQRVDAQFEAALAPLRRQLLEPFVPRAVVICTPEGAEQVQRHGADDGVLTRTFFDLGEAKRWIVAYRRDVT